MVAWGLTPAKTASRQTLVHTPAIAPARSSTPAVHKITRLTCADVPVPRIHRAYDDYYFSLSQNPKNQEASGWAHRAPRCPPIVTRTEATARNLVPG